MNKLVLAQEDMFIVDPKKPDKMQRLVYSEPIELTEFEEYHILYFMQYAKSVGYEISQEFMGKDRLLLKFIAGAKFDYVKAMKSMMDHSLWLRRTFPVSFGSVGPLLQSGIMYVTKRDKMFRPVVMVNIRRLLEQDYSIEELI